MFYGKELMKRSMAFRTLLDARIVAAAGSDFSPGPFDPRMAIQGMVTRTGWDGKTWGANQRISLDEALKINTINGAYNSHEESIKGSITVGKLADFVILDKDPHAVAPDTIKDLKVVRTVVWRTHGLSGIGRPCGQASLFGLYMLVGLLLAAFGM